MFDQPPTPLANLLGATVVLAAAVAELDTGWLQTTVVYGYIELVVYGYITCL